MSSTAKMHADELDIDATLVRGLISDQFPRWTGLPIRKVDSAGTDNAMYRLGEDMVVRLPRLPGGAHQVGFEQRWLPRLAPHLPLAVPEPVAKGEPGRGYALPWGVYRWLDGDNAYDAPISELAAAAVELGRFVAALRRVDATGGPASFRGGHVGSDDAYIRAAILDLGADGTLDADRATAAWQDALQLPQWDREPVWLHADLLPGNLLTEDGRLTAVIDFGGLGVGDPAADMLPAWTLVRRRDPRAVPRGRRGRRRHVGQGARMGPALRGERGALLPGREESGARRGGATGGFHSAHGVAEY